jgi:hypothetical protein
MAAGSGKVSKKPSPASADTYLSGSDRHGIDVQPLLAQDKIPAHRVRTLWLFVILHQEWEGRPTLQAAHLVRREKRVHLAGPFGILGAYIILRHSTKTPRRFRLLIVIHSESSEPV